MKRTEETELRPSDTVSPKAKSPITSYHNMVELQKRLLPPRPSSTVHCQISQHTVSTAASCRRSLKMQNKTQNSATSYSPRGFSADLQDQITGAKSICLIYFSLY